MPGEMRDLGASRAAAADWKPAGKSYVVAVGISKYANLDHLPNAVQDATRIVEVLKHCDFAEPPAVTSLFDEGATLDALNSLVRDQLRDALTPEDSLVLFYAGHGETIPSSVWDPEKPGQKKTVQTGYLLPVDARLTERAGWLRLDTFLDDIANLPALHILVILDACKSGFALSDKFKFRGADLGGALADLVQRPSRRVMTSAMHDQKAMDGGGSGNSLFTETLADAIENMEPDQDRDGFVTSRQLFDYVQTRVGDKARQVFNVKQTPDYGYLGGDGSGDLILSLQGDRFKLKQAAESLEAADAVYRLGQRTGEPKRFDFAARLYRAARDLAILGRSPSPVAELGLAKALLATGQDEEAFKTLSGLLPAAGAPDETGLWLGVALARRREHLAAATALSTWRAGREDHPLARWVAAYEKWLRAAAEGKAGRRRALLVGVGNHLQPEIPPLQAPQNDVQSIMAPLLRGYCGFASDDVVILVDAAATLGAMREAMEQLARESTSEDVVWVHFSGHSDTRPSRTGAATNEEPGYLIQYDAKFGNRSMLNSMSAVELHRRMQAIPATRKILALDTGSSEELVSLARRDGTYGLILPGPPGAQSYEIAGSDASASPCGLLTASIWGALVNANTELMTFDGFAQQTIAHAQSLNRRSRLTAEAPPVFEGHNLGRLFGPRDPFLDALETGEWCDLHALNADKLAAWSLTLDPASLHPDVLTRLGRRLLEEGLLERAIPVLERARDSATGDDLRSSLALCRAYLMAERYGDALAVFEATGVAASQHGDLLQVLREVSGAATKKALVVDAWRGAQASGDGAPQTEPLPGLLAGWGFDPANIVQLAGDAVTRNAVLEHLTRLLAQPAGTPVLFYYRGPGHTAETGAPIVLVLGEAPEQRVDLDDLRSRAAASPARLFAVLDAGPTAAARNWYDAALVAAAGQQDGRADQAARVRAYADDLRKTGVWVTSAFTEE